MEKVMTAVESPTGIAAWVSVRPVSRLSETVVPDFDRCRFTAASASHPGTVHDLYVRLGAPGSRELRVVCSCPAGRLARHGTPVPCRHARGLCELLEEHGLATPDAMGDRWLIVADATTPGRPGRPWLCPLGLLLVPAVAR
jgi:hypothetical protein